MVNLKFSEEISATPEKIWEILWSKDSYGKWAGSLAKDIYFEGDWSEGSEMSFFDAEKNGMYNLVLRNIPTKEMQIKHLGWIFGGEKKPENWHSGEKFLLEKNENGTVLSIAVDTTEEFASFYENKFPAALKKIKQLSEV